MRDDTDLPQHDHDEPGAGSPCADEIARHERELDLSAEEAWELLGSSDGLERWLGDRVDLDVAPGAEGTIEDGDERLLAEVESVEPGRRVSLRWWSEERGAAVVDLTLEPIGADRTRLIVTEIPVRALRIPATPAFIGDGLPGGGPQMHAAGARAFALA